MTQLPLTRPPQHLCLLRLSALGDISHMLPVLRTLQKHWPETRITWVIGKLEHQLVCDIPEIEFIIFDKNEGLAAYKKLRKQMRARHFDALLHMQMSLRASLASLLIPTRIRLGFDRQRAKDLQWMFTNHKIEHRPRQHVIDSFFGFTEALGIKEHVLEWNIPIPNDARQYATMTLDSDRKALIISPCSSMSYRNWSSEGYAAVADYASETYNMQVILCGGPSPIELEYGERVTALCRHRPLNLIGQTSVKQLVALLAQAELVLAPDSGPAHLATAVGTSVIGLYAATNPDRARPYLSADLVVNKYPEAIRNQYGKSVADMPWGTRARAASAMASIRREDVIAKLDQHLSTRPNEQPQENSKNEQSFH
ncbi:glycosyl transferase [Candidatus Tenderia electrophaga]|jgi:heptosyltransferase I|uniref:Glycosyl transferase n=1 Tax=Candidatus Tenderia electrophaga TaxID=1748243 RepID=A0A0S2TAM3_9GAMM|nr:glycosyl transferase [Candidatus Tenderia electrophaga]